MNTIFSMQDIFQGRLFRVPDYQRGYTWEEIQWQDLLEDLDLLPTGKSHFTGTLVLRAVPVNGGGFRDKIGNTYTTYEIIDGQQRLTTVVLLLDTIQDELTHLGLCDLADGIKNTYLVVRDRASQVHTRLSLNQDCQDFFYNDVLGFCKGVDGPQIWSHQQLQGAHDYFMKYLAEQCAMRGDGYPCWLQDLRDKITQGLRVLLYEVEDDADAGIVFETLNDRGKPLSEMEKVKNHLLYLSTKLDLPSPHDLAHKVNETWAYLFETLMAAGLGDQSNEDQLLRVHWLMAYEYDLKKWDNSRSIKAWFSLREYKGNHSGLLDDLCQYLDSLKNTVTAYCDIRNPQRASAFGNISEPQLLKEIIDFSTKFARLSARVNFLPLLIAVRLKTLDGGTTYRQVIELCEKIDFRLFAWQGARSFTAQTTFFRLGYDYFRRPDPSRLPAAMTRAAYGYCTNEQFSERFKLVNVDWYAWGGLKYFLYEYEQHLAQEARMPMQYRWEDLSGTGLKRDTIEHILPQSREDKYWKSRFTPKKHERWVHDIGNLTLTFDNECLGAKSFPKKKGRPGQMNCYATSKLFVESQLAKCNDWTEKQIRQRREALREWSVARWHLPPPPPDDPNELPEARMLRLAEENGMREGYEALLKTGHELGFHIRFQRKWRGISFTPQSSKTTTLFWIGPDLYVYIGYEMIEKHFQIPMQQVKQLLGNEQECLLDFEHVDEFIAGMKRLFYGAKEGISEDGETE